MAISASKVMELRAATGAGMMDCKKALEETEGDLEAARDLLRKKGISVAAKKSERATNEGGVGFRIAEDGKSVGIVQVACETDFVARNEEFDVLLSKLSGQALAKGGENFVDQTMDDGKGTVSDILTEYVGKLGENLQLVQAAQMEVKGEGIVGGYVHSNKKIGVVVALSSDKAVAAEGLNVLAKDLAMHIAASQVSAIRESEIDPAVLEKEKEIFSAQAAESGKPPEIVEKMVQGRIKKFVKEISLLDQSFVKDPDRTVAQLVEDTGKTLGAEVVVDQYVKFHF